uniref:Uncharacterized protein n=1 Tax=Nyssomyia neivai TaxID=330878 RepID=A0A1L8D7V2_9DIPT
MECHKFLFLCGNTLLTALPGLTDTLTSCLSLIIKHLGTLLFGLLLVNVFHEDALILEHITLTLHVEIVIQMPINFLCIPVLLEQAPEYTHPLHPQILHGHSRISCTFPLTRPTVTSLTTCFGILAHTVA